MYNKQCNADDHTAEPENFLPVGELDEKQTESIFNPSKKAAVESGKPAINSYRKKYKQTNGRSYKPQWADVYPWIIYSGELENITCGICTQYLMISGKKQTAHQADSFVNGFKNWKRVTEKLKIYDDSLYHRQAILTVQLRTSGADVSKMLDKKVDKLQMSSRKTLITILECLLFLAHQGIPLRGKTDKTSNFSN